MANLDTFKFPINAQTLTIYHAYDSSISTDAVCKHVSIDCATRFPSNSNDVVVGSLIE